MSNKWIGCLICFTLAGCSILQSKSVDHGADCTLGIPWADCQPGTKGFSNIGVKAQKARLNSTIEQFKVVHDQCQVDINSPELDIIRQKIELFKPSLNTAPSAEISTLDQFPSSAELGPIAKWQSLRDLCLKREAAVLQNIPTSNDSVSESYIQQQRLFAKETQLKIGELADALQNSKITYGEFATKSYELGKQAVNAQVTYKEAALVTDRKKQVQIQQFAQQQFDNNLMAWKTYIKAVNARKPRTVHLDGSVK